MNAQLLPKRLVKSREAAAILGISESGLAKWRMEGKGPRYYKIGKLISYSVRDLEEFMERSIVEPRQ